MFASLTSRHSGDELRVAVIADLKLVSLRKTKDWIMTGGIFLDTRRVNEAHKAKAKTFATFTATLQRPGRTFLALIRSSNWMKNELGIISSNLWLFFKAQRANDEESGKFFFAFVLRHNVRLTAPETFSRSSSVRDETATASKSKIKTFREVFQVFYARIVVAGGSH